MWQASGTADADTRHRSAAMSCIGIDIGQQNAGERFAAQPAPAHARLCQHARAFACRAQPVCLTRDHYALLAVVAIARRGGIDVLTNEVSKRLTACMVGFSGKERKLGEQALSGVSTPPPSGGARRSRHATLARRCASPARRSHRDACPAVRPTVC